MNVGSIIDKYFSDVLVAEGKIPDDDHEHVVFNSFSFGGHEPLNGHAIVKVIELIPKKENETMRILLDQEDIQAALDAHQKTLNLPGATGIELSVTDDGEIEAEVLMGDVKPRSKGGRPKGSKNKSKSEESEDDTETDSDASSDGIGSGRNQPSENSSQNRETNPTKGNPSETEVVQSSDSEEQDETDLPQEAAPLPPSETGPKTLTVKPKKASIFDVD